MIIPWIKGFLRWEKAPLTWTLVVLNLFIFLQTYEPHKASVTQKFSNSEMMILSGKLFYQFQHKDEKSLPLKTQSEWMMLGGKGLKDPEFVENAPSYKFYGDEIAIQNWKKDIRMYQNQFKTRNSHTFGLSGVSTSPLVWVTYQFMHASPMHLISNMLMLLIFAAALEVTLGGLALVVVYILGGFAGAWMFLTLGQNSLAPMIGASGSLSAVMAFYAAYEKKKRVSFFYFVSPLPGYYGWIYLPTLLIFPLCFLSDLAGYFSTPHELGTGVAYAAHIGGAAFGAMLGWSLRSFRRNIWVRWISHF